MHVVEGLSKLDRYVDVYISLHIVIGSGKRHETVIEELTGNEVEMDGAACELIN